MTDLKFPVAAICICCQKRIITNFKLVTTIVLRPRIEYWQCLDCYDREDTGKIEKELEEIDES